MKNLRMSLNIAMTATLLTLAACNSGSSSKSPSKEPELTGYWKGECVIDNGRAGYSDYVIMHFAEDGTLTQTQYKFDGTTCSGDALYGVRNNGNFTLGTLVSESPLTQEFYSIISCNEFWSTFKIQNNTLFVANTGGDGTTEENRSTDFTDADEYTPIAESDVPPYTEPVNFNPKVCLQ